MADVAMMSPDDFPEVYNFRERAFELFFRWERMYDRWPKKWSLCDDLRTLELE